MAYLETPHGFAYWAGEAIAGVVYPRSIASLWPEADLNAIGLYNPASADPVPAGKVSTGQVVQRIGGVVQFVHALIDVPEITLADRKAGLKAAIEAKGHAIRRQGFAWNFGTEGDPDWQVLELRAPGTPTPENDDEKNWSASLGAYTAAVIGGQAAVEGAVFRVQSNATYLRSYGEALGILTAMFAWIASILHVQWAKKDAASAATTHADLDAIEADIEVGWP